MLIKRGFLRLVVRKPEYPLVKNMSFVYDVDMGTAVEIKS